MKMTQLDNQLEAIFKEKEAASFDREKFKEIMEGLREELKTLWKDSSQNDFVVKNLIDNCLEYIMRPLGCFEENDSEFEERIDSEIDALLALFEIVQGAKRTCQAISHANRAKNIDCRILLKKLDDEKHLFFFNEQVKNVDGMAYRLYKWLNTRNALLEVLKHI